MFRRENVSFLPIQLEIEKVDRPVESSNEKTERREQNIQAKEHYKDASHPEKKFPPVEFLPDRLRRIHKYIPESAFFVIQFVHSNTGNAGT